MNPYITGYNIITPSVGYTLATQITCIPPMEDPGFGYASAITWYFGDGENITISSQTSAISAALTHTYKLPGTYSISAVAYVDTENDSSPEYYYTTASCKIVNYIDNAVHYTFIPTPTLPGCYTEKPYKIIYTTTEVSNPPVIDLYSEFSRSYPPQMPQNKWSFVRPEWKFVNLNGEKIDFIKPVVVPIKIDGKGNIDPNGILVGLSGSAEFYFIDDIYSVDFFIKDAPVPILWASMKVSAVNYYIDSDIKSGAIYGYSTSEVRAYAPHTSYWKLPDSLSITENGVANFVNQRWCGATVPFFVSAQLDESSMNRLKKYDPNTNFAKFLPFAVSALHDDYVPCSEDIPVQITVTGSASATFFTEDNTGQLTNNIGNYKFAQLDNNGYTSAGFARGSVKVFDEGVYTLSASAVVDFDKLNLPADTLVYSPYVWIPNPALGTLSMIYYTGTLNANFAKALNKQNITHSTKNIFTPLVNNINTTSQGITGFNGIYAVAASPGNEPDYEYYAWVADADLDALYKYDTSTNLVAAVNLRDVLGVEKVTPASICLDHNKELWVTCYDILSVLKFDIDGNFLFSINPSQHLSVVDPSFPGMFDATPTVSIFNDVLLLEPTCIDTDVQNNIWVSFSNPISSYLMKFSSTGTYITAISLPINSTPQDILIDNDNSFWCAETGEVYGHAGVLKKYDTNGNVLSAFNNIPNLGYLTYDVDGTPWFTYEYNKIGKIKNGAFTHVSTITSTNFVADYNVPPQVGPAGYIETAALEGIAASHKNLIFVVHSIDNNVYVYNAKNDALIDTITIADFNLGIYNDISVQKPRNLVYQEWNKSIQVIGDWTGIRWSRKYKKDFNGKVLIGTSVPLYFNKLNPQEIRKHNQDFNMTDQLKSAALSPILKDNSFLFDVFLKSIYGNSANSSDAGTVFYEKTANFLANHNDIDTCEIDSLYNLAEMLDVAVDDYRLSFPAQLRQIMNLLSITHSKLWGVRCRCNASFRSQENCTLSDICKICGKCKINNRGEKIEASSFTVKEGSPFVIYDKDVDSYFVHYPSTIDSLSSYNTSQLTAIGLATPIEDKYDFYNYIPSTNNFLVEGVIDWDNPYTTLNPTLSTYNDWVQNKGIIDNILNFYLYKGLNLI